MTDDSCGVEAWADLRGAHLADSDLRDCAGVLRTVNFDTRTVWPPQERMPESWSPDRALEFGRDPGLGLREMHADGLTGKGVDVAIIDQPLGVEHVEFRHAIESHAELGRDHPQANDDWWHPQMHGPAVTALLAGITCGAAPGARVHYYDHPMWLGYQHTIEALRAVLAANKARSVDEAIRVVSVSTGFKRDDPLFPEWLVALDEAAEAGVIVVHCSKRLGYAGCDLEADRDDSACYRLASFYETAGDSASDPAGEGKLFVPCDNRTLGSPEGPSDYAFFARGGGSWGVPWLAGVIAIGLQVSPQMGEEECFAALRETGTSMMRGALVNPRRFVERIRAN